MLLCFDLGLPSLQNYGRWICVAGKLATLRGFSLLLCNGLRYWLLSIGAPLLLHVLARSNCLETANKWMPLAEVITWLKFTSGDVSIWVNRLVQWVVFPKVNGTLTIHWQPELNKSLREREFSLFGPCNLRYWPFFCLWTQTWTTGSLAFLVSELEDWG